MNKDKARQLLVVLSAIGMITVNVLANALPINGQTTGEISDRFDVYFVPAGYVFSIWGLIYLGMIAYAIYQALPSQSDESTLQRIGYLFVLSSLANSGWILFWHYEYYFLTMVTMLVLLGLLIAIYLRLQIGRYPVSRQMKWSVHVPFSIYLGWITVATVANVTSLLSFWNWGGWGISPEIWTVIMLTVGVVLGAVAALSRGDVAYNLVLVWAFAGIAIKHGETSVVSTTAWLAAAIVAVLMVAGAYRHSQADRATLATN